MSGAFASPHALTSGAGYKANPAWDPILRKHSGFYRRYSAAGAAHDEDRRRSSVVADMADQALEAVKTTSEGETAQNGATAAKRRSSVAYATAGAATANDRRGSVVVGSSAGRKESIFGLESTRGHVGVGTVIGDVSDGSVATGRRPSTSLAHDLMDKWKGRRMSSQAQVQPQTQPEPESQASA